MKKALVAVVTVTIFFGVGVLTTKFKERKISLSGNNSSYEAEIKEPSEGNSSTSVEIPTTKEQQKLEELATSSVQKQIAGVLAVNVAEESNPELQPLREKLVAQLQKSPESTIEEISNLLGKLPAKGQELSRLRLLILSTLLEGVDEERKEVAYKEMTSQIPDKRPDPNTAETEEELNRALSTTFEMSVPLVAHSIFISSVTDKNEAVSKTIEAVTAQQEPYIQRGIVNQFAETYPEEKEMILQELADKGINPFQTYEDQQEEEVDQNLPEDDAIEFVKENN